MEVKNRLKSIRHQHEMNQKQFADLLNIAYNQYNRYEKQQDQPSLLTVLKLAQKLSLPVEQIVYLNDDPGE
ncbi:MAG: hypothetical protein JL56_04570 [Desulfotomaculum sp. BICA1-6]|nr:MAG: hypothetical protein JL56_04570 [Desulfotomaculum sp. BICA1-6]